ncbi:MAG: T9SS type A sorting domain-containing protein, partial [Bacteroidota bacterium]
GFASGTSLSTPLITSLVAGVWQRYPDLTNKELIAVLKKTASQANNPDNLLGYGIPNFRAVVNYLEPIVQTSILEVFPNPVIDTVNIRPDNPDEISSARVEVISAQGQILIQQTINFSWYARTYQSSLASLATGTYFMRIWIGDRKFIFKIIKA